MLDSFLNKDVIIILPGPFSKFGKLVAVDDNFIYLQFNTGEIRGFGKNKIEEIKEDPMSKNNISGDN